jgi:hypothetical protein
MIIISTIIGCISSDTKLIYYKATGYSNITGLSYFDRIGYDVVRESNQE